MRILNEIPTLKDLTEVNPNLKALFWDMDGTLLNTEIIHARATFDVINSFAGEVPLKSESLLNFVLGQTDGEVYQRLIKGRFIKEVTFGEFVETKDELFIKLIENSPSDTCLNPKIKILLEECLKNQIDLALVTSSEKKIAHSLISNFKLTSFFKHFITREDTSRNKPDPAPYNLALTLCDLKPREALIFEDSPIGLEAARLSRIPFCQVNWY